MSAVSVVVGKLDANAYPGSKEDINNLYRGVDQIRPAVAQLASLPETPEPDTVTLAKSVLEKIAYLPPITEDTVRELQTAVDDRKKAQC